MKVLSKEQLDRVLLALLGSVELVEKWWDSPNKAFDLKKPSQCPWHEVQQYILGFYDK